MEPERTDAAAPALTPEEIHLAELGHFVEQVLQPAQRGDKAALADLPRHAAFVEKVCGEAQQLRVARVGSGAGQLELEVGDEVRLRDGGVGIVMRPGATLEPKVGEVELEIGQVVRLSDGRRGLVTLATNSDSLVSASGPVHSVPGGQSPWPTLAAAAPGPSTGIGDTVQPVEPPPPTA